MLCTICRDACSTSYNVTFHPRHPDFSETALVFVCSRECAIAFDIDHIGDDCMYEHVSGDPVFSYEGEDLEQFKRKYPQLCQN